MSTVISQQHSKPGAGREVTRLPEIVCRETIFRCDLNCLSPSFCLPELLVLSSCSRTKLLLVESGGQVCHKQAAGASTMVVSRVITAPFVVIDVNTCPTPPHHLHTTTAATHCQVYYVPSLHSALHRCCCCQ